MRRLGNSACDHLVRFGGRVKAEGVFVWQNVISEVEEGELMVQLDKVLRRRRYETGHWDQVIDNYREMERELSWFTPSNASILQNIAADLQQIFHIPHFLPHLHILDYAPDGVVRPHVDSIRFSGGLISGLSLLSDCVMRLEHKDGEAQGHAQVLLPRRSMYAMTDSARYDFTHEISNKAVEFDHMTIPRERRVSLMMRDAKPDGRDIKGG